MVAIGHSAGGHLAARAAARADTRVPLTGVVSQAGVLDLYELAWSCGSSDGVVRQLLGGTPDEVPRALRAASPARAAAARRPAAARPRRARRGSSPVTASAISRRRAAAGDDCELVVIPARTTIEHIEPGVAALAAVIEWLRLTREQAEALDAADPLAGFRERFVLADRPRIYLDGNSLGRLPVATRERLRAVVDQWGEGLVSGWPEWIDAARRGRATLLARACSAPRPARCWSATRRRSTCTSSCAAALDARGAGAAGHRPRQLPDRPLRARGPGRRSAGSSCGMFDADPLDGPQPEDLERPADGAGRWSCSRTSPTAPARSPTWRRSQRVARRAARRWSGTSRHSAGAVPVELRDAGVELAVGCTYKYLNGGPGAPAFLYVAAELQARLRSPIWGWFGQRDQFAMERDYDPVRRHRPLPRRHADDPRARRGRGGRAAHRRGRHGARCARSRSR